MQTSVCPILIFQALTRFLTSSIIMLSILVIPKIYGHEKSRKSALLHKERSYNLGYYNLLFNNVISATNLWEGPSWSTIELSFNQVDREFKTPQMFGNGNYIQFETESIQKLDSLPFAFYGKFRYKTSRDFNSEFNQFYKIEDNGNPFYFFTPAKGKWETQEYFFKGGASIQLLKDKVFVGASMGYAGDLYNRIIDIRNRQTNLLIEISPSVTYKISQINSISLGFRYTRHKYEPIMSNYYQRPGDDRTYWLYLNKGMGTHERVNMGFGLYFLTNSYDLTGQWIGSVGDDLMSVDFTYHSGINSVDSKNNIPQTNDFYKLGKYELNRLNGRIGYKRDLFGFKSLNNLFFEKSNGSGFTHNDQQNQYQKSYSYSAIKAGLSSHIFPGSFLVNHFKVGLKIEDISGLDLNYGQKYSFINVVPELMINMLNHKFLKGYMSYGFTLNANLNLGFSHDPVGAKTSIYTTSILYPTLTYKTLDYLVAAPSVLWEKNLKNNYMIGFELGGSIAKPIKINYINTYTSTMLTDINNSVYIVFKFIF